MCLVPFVLLTAISIAACVVALVYGIRTLMKMEKQSWDKIEKLQSEKEEK